MAYADLPNNKVVTDVNLDGAVSEFILNKKDGSFPQTNRALTKQLALERYDLKTAPLASTANNQLVAKSKIEGCFRTKWFNNTANCVTIYGSTIYVGGNFTMYADSYPCNRIVRLFNTGRVDTSFNIGSGFNGEVRFIKSLGSTYGNVVLVGGSFTTYNGQPVGKIVVLNPDGALARTNLGITNEPSDCHVANFGAGILYVTFSDNSHFMKRYFYDATLSEDTTFVISSYLAGKSARKVFSFNGSATEFIVAGDFAFFFNGKTYSGFVKISGNGQFFPEWFVSYDGVNPVNANGYGGYTEEPFSLAATTQPNRLLLHGTFDTPRGREGVLITSLEGVAGQNEPDISSLQIPNANNPYLSVVSIKNDRIEDVTAAFLYLVCSELTLHTFRPGLFSNREIVASSSDSPRAFKQAVRISTNPARLFVVGEFPSLVGYNNKRIVKLKEGSTSYLEVDTDCV
jgi:hypothetical protein